MTEEGGGEPGNRRLRNAVIGKAVPVRARTSKKKNSQRGPTVGKVLITSPASPPQPTTNSRIVRGKNEIIEGEERDDIA
jgi:hypothetical protein